MVLENMFGVENELLLGMGIGAATVWYLWNKFDELDHPEPPRRLRKFTLEDLALYSGEGERLCYVAVEDQIFDCTKDSKSFVGVGKGGGSLLKDAKIADFEGKYTKVGTLIIPRNFSAEELRGFDGRNGGPVYLAAKGVVYDVDPEFYGPDGPYGIMAGRDATRALALLSLDQKDVDHPNPTEGLTSSDLNTLNEWVAKFELKYNRVGFLLPGAEPASEINISNHVTAGADVRPTFLTKQRQKVKLQEKIEISHDTRVFRFALENPSQILGLPIGKHVKIWCPSPQGIVVGEWNGVADAKEQAAVEIERKYTPSSIDSETSGYFDLVIKVYRGGEVERFPDGGKMSQYMDTLQVDDYIDIAGPYGLNEYLGKGQLKVRRKILTVSQIGMLAGGTGITPMLQVTKAILSDPEDKTKISLLFANQEEKDILVRDMLEELQEKHPERLKIHYTLDRPPTTGWEYSTGFITAEMIQKHLPPPGEGTVMLMCGPPAMVKFACKQNMDALGYPKDAQIEF